MSKKALLRSVEKARHHQVLVVINKASELMHEALRLPRDITNLQPVNVPTGQLFYLDLIYGRKQKVPAARRP